VQEIFQSQSGFSNSFFVCWASQAQPNLPELIAILLQPCRDITTAVKRTPHIDVVLLLHVENKV